MKGELDLSKYDGAPEEWIPRANLDADAPLLLAEVRRLREELADLQRQKYGTPCKCEAWIAACGDAEEKLDALRQSHARLLEALLLVGRVERRGGVPYYNTSGSLIHQDQMRELGAAVAEAEALHGE